MVTFTIVFMGIGAIIIFGLTIDIIIDFIHMKKGGL